MNFLTTLSIFIITIGILWGLNLLYMHFLRKSAAEWATQEEFQENKRNAQVIDVREKDDYNRGHILGARSVPYTVSKSHKEYLTAIRKDKPVYLYDNKATLAIYMARLLKKQGYTDIYILKGGYSSWTGKTKQK